MKKTPSATSALITAKLLSTDCTQSPVPPSSSANASLEINADMLLGEDIQGEQCDFAVDLTIALSAVADQGEEHFNVNCRFRGEYKFRGKPIAEPKLRESTHEYGQQVYLVAREFLSDVLTRMRIIPSFLPYDFAFPGEAAPNEAAQKAKKE